MVEAARLLLSRVEPMVQPTSSKPAIDPILGLMHDDLNLMDEIVADADRQRLTGERERFQGTGVRVRLGVEVNGPG